MSTVLKAVQEMEGRTASRIPDASAPSRPDHGVTVWAGVGVAALVVIAVGYAALRPASDEIEASALAPRGAIARPVAAEPPAASAPVVAAAPVPASEPARAVAPEPARHPAPEPAHLVAAEPVRPAAAEPARVAAARSSDESPWGRVAESAPAIVEAPGGEAPRQKERSVRAAPKRAPRVAAARVAAPPVVEERFDDLAPELPLDAGDADPPARAPRGGTRASEMPSVQVRGIAYDSDSAARTVTLRVAGGRAVTLHEGQSASGVNVQLIMPNVVYLRHGGDIFALSP